MPRNTNAKSANKPRAGLIFICDKQIAQAICDKFKPNSEASALLALPLYQNIHQFTANSVAELAKYCVANHNLVQTAFQEDLFPFSFGFGMNHCTLQFLQNNWSAILSNVNLEKDVLLSTVEKPSVNYGYPNLDLTGCVGFGKFEEGEGAEQAGVRETFEESRIDFKESDHIQSIPIQNTEISSFKLVANSKTSFAKKASKVMFVVKILSNAEDWEVIANENQRILCKRKKEVVDNQGQRV